MTIPGRGEIHFVLTRVHRSRLNMDGYASARSTGAAPIHINALGWRWTHNYAERLFVQPNGDIRRFGPGGHIDTWVRNPDGTFAAPRGQFRTLVQEPGGTYVLRSPNGFKRYYRADGSLEKHADRDGNTMHFKHDGRGNLAVVIDAYGREIQFFHHSLPDGFGGSVDRLVGIRDFSGREVRYGYDMDGDLKEARSPIVVGTPTGNDFPRGRSERYTYTSESADPQLNHKILSVTFPEEVATDGPPGLSWTYGTDPNDPATYAKVTSETLGGTNASGVPAGGTTNYRYERLNGDLPFGDPDLARGRVTIADRNGRQSEWYGNERGEHILTHDLTRGLRPNEPAYYATRSYYNDDGLLVRRVFPSGNETRWTYDSNGARGQQKNVVEIRRVADPARGGGEDLVTRMAYEPIYNRLACITEPRGNAQNYHPPIQGAASISRASRYTTRFYYDYQEGPDNEAHKQRLADELGLSLQEVRNLIAQAETQIEAASGLFAGSFTLLKGEDLNDDGRTDQVAGNLVRVEEPSVTLLQDSKVADRLGSTEQRIVTEMQWNIRGQITRTIDPEGNVTQYEYYPENDPDGDGRNIIPSRSSDLTGYLSAVIVDSEASYRRRIAAAPAVIETAYGYDPVGNVVWVRNPRGVVTRIEVNALNEPVVIVRGAEVDEARDSGQLLTGEEAFGYQTRLFYDHNGRVVKRFIENRDGTTEGVGAFVKRAVAYDILGQAIEQSVQADPFNTFVTRYRYDPSGLLTEVIQPEGNVRLIAYDERNLIFKVTRGSGSPQASTVQFDYDDNGNLKRRVDAEDKDGDGQPEATTFAYDGFDRRIKVTDPLGGEVHLAYDPASNRTSTRAYGHPAGQPEAPIVLLAEEHDEHDELDRIVRAVQKLFLSKGFDPVRAAEVKDRTSGDIVPLDDEDNARDVTTRFEYDALSRLTFTMEDDGEVFERVYDGAGRLTESVDAVGNRLLREYDRNANPINVTSIEVSPERLVSEKSFKTRYVYDQLDRLVRATDNVGQTTRFGYDSRDNLIIRADPQGAPTADPLGLFPGQINDPGNTRSFHYDGRSLLICEVSDLRQGGTGGGVLDVSNSHNPDGQVALRYAYDGNARLIGIIDDNGNRTSFGYDALDRRTSETNADGTAHTYFYDRDDNILQIVDPNGSEINRSFDALARLIRCSVLRAPGVAGTTRQAFAYDGLSRLTKSTDDNGDPTAVQTFERVYDSLSRLLEERQNGQAVSSVFTGDGKRVRCTYPGGRQITSAFDTIDRIKTISDEDGVISEAFYIGPGLRELKRTAGNGTTLSFLNDAGDEDIGYDDVKRIVRLRCFLPNGAEAFLDREYGYNRADQRTFEQRHDDLGLTDRYTHDSLYRLARTRYDQDGEPGATTRKVARADYVLDGVGNRRLVDHAMSSGRMTQLAYAVNEMNEYTAVDGAEQVHDGNGNLTDDGKRRFVYDYRNRLVAVFRKSNNAPVARYFYQADNRRARKIVFSLDDPGAVEKETLYLYDGWRVCEEQSTENTTKTTYVYSPVYIDEVVQLKRAAAHPLGEGTFYLHQNARADVVAVTDAAGSVVDRRFYDDYGRGYDEDKQAVGQSAVGNPYGFQGRRLDPETGLYYFRNRYYDPETGRFLQRDPVWDVHSFGNDYMFASSNPISERDALGLQTDFGRRSGDRGASMGNPEFTDPLVERLEAELAEAKVKESKVGRIEKEIDNIQDEIGDELHGRRNAQQRAKLREANNRLTKAKDELSEQLERVEDVVRDIEEDAATGGRARSILRQRTSGGKAAKLLRKWGRRVPYIGIFFAVVFYVDECEAKGFAGGTTNTLLDAIPYFGFAKGIIELFTGDWIPDAPAGSSTPPAPRAAEYTPEPHGVQTDGRIAKVYYTYE